jgi:hypothetical protein
LGTPRIDAIVLICLIFLSLVFIPLSISDN